MIRTFFSWSHSSCIWRVCVALMRTIGRVSIFLIHHYIRRGTRSRYNCFVRSSVVVIVEHTKRWRLVFSFIFQFRNSSTWTARCFPLPAQAEYELCAHQTPSAKIRDKKRSFRRFGRRRAFRFFPCLCLFRHLPDPTAEQRHTCDESYAPRGCVFATKCFLIYLFILVCVPPHRPNDTIYSVASRPSVVPSVLFYGCHSFCERTDERLVLLSH